MIKNNIEEKNSKRKEEIDQIIGNLELVQNDLKALLLEEDTKLSIEKGRLSELSSLSTKLRNKKDRGTNDFLMSTTIFLSIVLMQAITSLGTLFYLVLVIYLLKVPKFIKLYKMIKNKDIENLENAKSDIKNKIDESLYYKRMLEQRIRKTQYKIEEMAVEKSVLEDISFYFENQEEIKCDREFNLQRTRQM